MIQIDITKATQFVGAEKVAAYEAGVQGAKQALEDGTRPGNDFLGWMHLPTSITAEFIAELQACANVLRENCDTVIVAGIGGSYLGARAVIDALANSFAWLTNKGENPNVLFAGNNIGEDYLYELTEYLKDKNFGVINISKSGTTTETALAFRLLKKQCEEQRGKEVAKKVIVAVTDAKKGAARTTADKEGYTFVNWGEVDEKVPAHDVVYVANYEVNYYKLTYILDDVVYGEFDVAFGETIIPLEVDPVEGRLFEGWQDMPVTMPSHDVKVYGTTVLTNISVMATEGSHLDVYTLGGILVKKNVDMTTLRSTLDPGIYIINGKKVKL